MNIRPARLEALVWVLIYGGLFGASLGFALHRRGAAFGWALVVAGAIAVVCGVVLIWVRSRLRDSGTTGADIPPRKERQTS